MNSSIVVFLVNKTARALLATYESETENKNPPKAMFKTLDPSISKGDFIVVPTNTRHLMTVCKVVEVDVEVDFDNQTPVQWVIGKVDETAHKQVLAMEENLLAVVKSAERKKKQDELRAAILADSMDAIKALPISEMDVAALPPAQS